MLQSCSGLRIIFYRLEKTSLLGRFSQKLHHDHFIVFFNENETKYVEIIIPSNIENHVAITLVVQVSEIRYSFMILQP